METNYSSKKIGGYLLAFFLLFGVITVASSTTQAQWDRNRRDRDWDNRDRSRVVLQTARQQGYSFGMNVGAADAQRGQSFNPQRSRYYKNPSLGSNASYADRRLYQQVFRDAFVQGYRDGYQRFAYQNNGRWRRR